MVNSGPYTEMEHVARPLLELMQRISGLETTFITRIDWTAQRQEVVLALNTSDELEVAERSELDWTDSMCRWAFLSGKEQSSDVPGDFPGSRGADRLGMQTFFAVPILSDDEKVMGTACGASRDVVPLSDETLALMRLVCKSLSHQMQTEVAARAMEVLALTDGLTGLANQRGFTSRFEEELARSGRHDYLIAVLRLDVDRFKDVNDTHGHEAGDRVLKSLSATMRRVSRIEDVAARPGGDEFILVVPYADAAAAQLVAARIRAELAEAMLDLEGGCTVSIGIASSAETPRRELMAAADRALYQAKKSGGDSSHVWQGGAARTV